MLGNQSGVGTVPGFAVWRSINWAILPSPPCTPLPPPSPPTLWPVTMLCKSVLPAVKVAGHHHHWRPPQSRPCPSSAAWGPRIGSCQSPVSAWSPHCSWPAEGKHIAATASPELSMQLSAKDNDRTDPGKCTHQCDETRGNNSTWALLINTVLFGCTKRDKQQKKKEADKQGDDVNFLLIMNEWNHQNDKN